MFHVPRVIDHYEYLPNKKIQDIVDISHNECFICLEIYTDDKITPIDWKTQNKYLKLCECGGYLHLCCINKWYNVANSCPICRKFMTIPDSNEYIFFLDLNNFNISKIFIIIIYCFQIWNIFVWVVIATLCSYHIYSRFDSTPPNIFSDDDNINIFDDPTL
jgi:hypothetical protein